MEQLHHKEAIIIKHNTKIPLDWSNSIQYTKYFLKNKMTKVLLKGVFNN